MTYLFKRYKKNTRKLDNQSRGPTSFLMEYLEREKNKMEGGRTAA